MTSATSFLARFVGILQLISITLKLVEWVEQQSRMSLKTFKHCAENVTQSSVIKSNTRSGSNPFIYKD